MTILNISKVGLLSRPEGGLMYDFAKKVNKCSKLTLADLFLWATLKNQCCKVK